jgi:hypothetical protein
MTTANVSRCLLSSSEAVTNNDQLLWLHIRKVCKINKTSKFQKIKPLAGLTFHILDISRTGLDSDTENTVDWRGFIQSAHETDGTIQAGYDLFLPRPFQFIFH